MHASLILERHPLCPFTGALADQKLPDRQQLIRILTASLAKALLFDSPTACQSLPAKILAAARQLETTRYQTFDAHVAP